jgi:repressor LexA
MKELTAEQSRVFGFITECMEKLGMPPTIREIADHFGYKSINNVRQHLNLIAKKGYIRLMQGKARGIEVTVGIARRTSRNEIQVPLVGTVAAGKPLTALENIDEYVTLDSTLFHGEGLFTLRVKGDSMEGIGILNGDLAIIRQQSTARDTDVVVALIDDEATLKRYFRRGSKIVLHAENPRYEDIVVEQDRQVAVLGKLVGVIRKY